MAIRAGVRTLPVIVAAGFLLAGCSSSSGPSIAANRGAGHSWAGHPHYTAKPYEVNGVWYYPKVDYAYDQTGTASWYGPGFDGRATADGEVYDMNGLTAAHKTLPLPSVVTVTNLQNGRELRLRVNDRGPFVGDRLIDVSRRAAQLLGFARQGTAPVRIQIDKDDSIRVAQAAMHGEFGETAYAEAAPAAQVAVAAPQPPPATRLASTMPPSLRAAEVISTPQPMRLASTASPPSRAGDAIAAPLTARRQPAPPSREPALPVMAAAAAPPVIETAPPPVVRDAVRPTPQRVAAAAPRHHRWPSLIPEAYADTLPRVVAEVLRRRPPQPHAAGREGVLPQHAGGIFIQAGAFAVPKNAERARARIAPLGHAQVLPARIRGALLYRVRLGPVRGEAEAHRLLGKVVARGYKEARLVDR